VYSETINQLIHTAVEQILDEMCQDGPYMAQQAEAWFHDLAGTDHPADYFQHPLAFPMLLLPWWMEQTIHARPDVDFQADLIYSSINGYYFIRMIDNVMDGHGTVEHKLLPMLGFFHTEFHAAYHAYFAGGHPFWAHFKAIGIQSAESALRDAALTDIDQHKFKTIAGRKVSGGKIPLAAVAYRYDCPHLFQTWQPFYDKLGCWHQMYNDLFGWLKDLNHHTPSYFLSEGRRRKEPDQSLAAWVIHGGFAWGVELLESWLNELRQVAEELHSRELLAYLSERQSVLQNQSTEVTGAFHSLERLLLNE
jgi:hypothetical protein